MDSNRARSTVTPPTVRVSLTHLWRSSSREETPKGTPGSECACCAGEVGEG
eukprot:CAMPEP_0175940576 /NCGR_PEP_ID=MMETSP0108-20121206/23895_1 /TAXON_ID=195067 ORGANISM="Goniomonas pacifica, Strain CCMP1869" /NCGR_SAMPLE_ID=MMETSP0108 /ASSEMBLY_ACC=CAM_ASM_000204 /LENGTH=50 /DNA_ID=CAMNT_0017265087 /DNA_START=193 /DNA_END=345 /DNA_ORIENTATION=+